MFSHGQLYVAMSRVSDPKDITVFLDSETEKHGFYHGSPYTQNIVHQQLLQDEIERYKESDDYKGDDHFDEGHIRNTLPTIYFLL